MVLPLLLFIVLLLFLIGRANAAKISAATKARSVAWSLLPDAPTKAFDIAGKAEVSWSYPESDFEKGLVFRGELGRAYSSTGAVGNTWAYNTIVFASLENNCLPHMDVLFSIPGGGKPPVAFDRFNPDVVSSLAPLSQPLNTAVQIAGAICGALGGTLEPFQEATSFLNSTIKKLLDNPVAKKARGILNTLTGGRSDKAIKDFENALDQVNRSIDVFSNLADAAQGKSGDRAGLTNDDLESFKK